MLNSVIKDTFMQKTLVEIFVRKTVVEKCIHKDFIYGNLL